MKLSTISLLYIWSSIASTQAGIIARTINDSQNEVNKITHTERAERPREYTPNSKTNSKCNSKNKLPEKPKGNHRSHQKYSKEAWSSDLNASKHDESSGSQDAHINDTDNRVPEIGIDFQRKKEVDLTKLHNQRNRLGSEEIHGSKQGAESIDSIEIVLRKGSNTDGGRSKIKEIEITLHSSNPESTAAEDNISIELTTNGLVRELGHSKAFVNNDDDVINQQEVIDEYPDAEPRNPVLSNLSSPPSHRGFRTGIPDDQIEAQDTVGNYADGY